MLANTLPLIIAAMVFSLTSLTANSESAPSQPDTLTTQVQSIPHYVTLEAKLEAIKQSTVSAQTQGIVEMVNFDINDKVEAGQVLILINSSQQRASLSQAKAALAQAQALNTDAQTILKRNHSLLTKRTLSQGEFDSSLARANSAEASVLAAEAMVKQAKEQVSYTRITAPYSGIVRQRFVQMGELVNPGQPVMTGFALKPLRAVVDIPQKLATKLSTQAKLDNNLIHIIANGKHYPASQFTLFPYADSRYSSIRARIDLADSDDTQGLIPGAWVQVQLPSGQQHGIYLPASAILQQGEVASVLVMQNQDYKLRYVRLGQTQQDGRIRIMSGLEAGEQVAIDVLAAAMSAAVNKEAL
ncbi:Putative AcrA/AcrE family protein [Oleispira antarctica RB-8]|uniref:Putative AcrA/AcrE family protein n=1 Tax=Oleispira antarctica RB-8 TaxID=698738 RepID=R4YTR0_OLEAN|nr:Putative AcrA/AcrE family protein [Oleispira antarctica RB-8]